MLEVDLTTFQSLNLSIASCISVFVCLLMLGKMFFTCPLLDKRLKDLGHQYSHSSVLYAKESLKNQFFQRSKKFDKKDDKKFKKKIVDYIIKNHFSNVDMKTTFEQAGWNIKETPFFFFTSKLICFLIGLGIGYILILTKEDFYGSSLGARWSILTLTSLSGWILPNLYLSGRIKNRVGTIERQFPDALDLIIICLQSGLGLNRALGRVAKEIGSFGKEIGHELSITNTELEVMLDNRQALQNFYARVPSSIIRTFTTTLLQSIQQGTPTLQALDVLSKEIRSNRMHKAEAKAAKLPSLLVIPLIIFVMPNLFIVLLGPSTVRFLNAM